MTTEGTTVETTGITLEHQGKCKIGIEIVNWVGRFMQYWHQQPTRAYHQESTVFDQDVLAQDADWESHLVVRQHDLYHEN